jgi:putative N6-adenine-specific DNA methylase
VATCARGLEELLEREAREAGLAVDGRDVGGVRFRGDLAAGVRANWRLRVANRVLAELGSWPAPDDERLYQGALDLVAGEADDPRGLGELFAPSRSFAVSATSSRSALRDTRWIALRVKDGLVDGQRRRYGRRADVERDRPDVAYRLRLAEDRATLLVDTSGDPLDRRGYRVATTAAPVREQLAAAALAAAGWDGRGPVVDPMCGSGTFLAEAGAVALGLAPNRLRARWGFERLPGYRPELLARARAEPFAAPDPAVRLLGADRDPSALAAARRNLAAAGLAGHAALVAADAFELDPPATPGLVVVNPPHGERLAGGEATERRLGDLLKRRYRGWKAVVLAGGATLGKSIGLRPTRRWPVWNGPLEARLLVFELW